MKEDLTASVELIKSKLGNIVAANDAKAALQGLDILHRLIGNILKHPHEDKYRHLKTTIPKIQSTLFSLKGEVDELILALGYIKSGDAYLFAGDSTRLLKKGQF